MPNNPAMADDTHSERHAFTLRMVAERANAVPVRTISKQPGVSAVYRLTIYYHDRRARDTVATIRRTKGADITLTITYDGLFREKVIVHPVSPQRYEAFDLALRKLPFDKLADQPRLPNYGSDLWLVERAAGTFIHSVVLAPQTASDVYAQLAETMTAYLPEALKEVH